jgi:hypothetical protein
MSPFSEGDDCLAGRKAQPGNEDERRNSREEPMLLVEKKLKALGKQV